MLGPFFNTLTADHMYCCHKFQKFQRSYLQNQKHSCKLLLDFSNLRKILSVFEKKDNLHTFIISWVIDSEKGGYMNARMIVFQNILLKLTC